MVAGAKWIKPSAEREAPFHLADDLKLVERVGVEIHILTRDPHLRREPELGITGRGPKRDHLSLKSDYLLGRCPRFVRGSPKSSPKSSPKTLGEEGIFPVFSSVDCLQFER